MTGPAPALGMDDRAAAARDAAQALAGRPPLALRAVAPGTGGTAWMAGFGDARFLCLDEDLQPVTSLTRVQDIAQTAVATEVVEERLDGSALRALRGPVEVLAARGWDLPTAVEALGRAVGAAEDLAAWREDPEREVASLVAMDAAIGIQQRAHAAYATFAALTEPLVQRQDELDTDLLAALVAVEQAAADAGLGASLGAMLGEGMGGIAEAADEVARGHLTPLR